MEPQRRIFSHVNVDPDAFFSLWSGKKYIPRYQNAIFVFVPAYYDGSGMTEYDIAVDIDAGGRGIKGDLDENNNRHSCFKKIMETYAPEEDREALRHIIDYVDLQDTFGNAVNYAIPNLTPEQYGIATAGQINMMLRAIQCEFPDKDDQFVVDYMIPYVEGILKMKKSFNMAKKGVIQMVSGNNGNEVIRFELLGGQVEVLEGGQVALVRNMDRNMIHGVRSGLYSSGVKIIVDSNDCNLSIGRKNEIRMRVDHPIIRKVVEATGEQDDWFAHESGYLYGRGGSKGPYETPSKVDPYELAKAVNEAFHLEMYYGR